MLRYILSFAFTVLFCTSWSQTYNLGGQITDVADETVGGAILEVLNSEGQILATTTTDCSGTYLFSGLEAGVDYHLRVNKQGSFLNGNSTFDLVIITKHLLGTQELPTPYQVIAADIDESGSISVLDLLYLRALILAILEDYPGQNWLFFRPGDTAASTDFDFVLSSDLTDFDLITIKKGDVNGSAIPCE